MFVFRLSSSASISSSPIFLSTTVAVHLPCENSLAYVVWRSIHLRSAFCWIWGASFYSVLLTSRSCRRGSIPQVTFFWIWRFGKVSLSIRLYLRVQPMNTTCQLPTTIFVAFFCMQLLRWKRSHWWMDRPLLFPQVKWMLSLTHLLKSSMGIKKVRWLTGEGFCFGVFPFNVPRWCHNLSSWLVNSEVLCDPLMLRHTLRTWVKVQNEDTTLQLQSLMLSTYHVFLSTRASLCDLLCIIFLSSFQFDWRGTCTVTHFFGCLLTILCVNHRTRPTCDA